MSLRETFIVPKERYLTHQDACGIGAAALRALRDSLIVIDMSQVDETNTSAFARLVLLRRQLRKQGRDLRLRGLRDRTEVLYHLNRLGSVLPMV